MPIRDIAAQNRSLDNDYGTTRAAAAPGSFEVALFAADPRLGGTELAATNGYARAALSSDDWPAATDGVKRVTVTFPAPTGPWSTVTHWGLYDPAGGAWWDCAPLVAPLEVTTAGPGPTLALAIFYDNNPT